MTDKKRDPALYSANVGLALFSKAGHVFVGRRVNGRGASELAGLNKQDLAKSTSQWLANVRPASQGKLDIYHIQNWTKDNPFAGGAYMHWAPGQIRKWAEDMGQHAGRLHFCGEHLSHLHTGMEGAMESAENAVFRLLDI